MCSSDLLDVVLPGAAKLPVGKRSNGDGGQTGQQINFQHPAIHQNENDNSHRLHRKSNERRLQPQPQKRPQVHRLQRGLKFGKQRSKGTPEEKKFKCGGTGFYANEVSVMEYRRKREQAFNLT